jgi:hypothetical protein
MPCSLMRNWVLLFWHYVFCHYSAPGDNSRPLGRRLREPYSVAFERFDCRVYLRPIRPR